MKARCQKAKSVKNVATTMKRRKTTNEKNCGAPISERLLYGALGPPPRRAWRLVAVIAFVLAHMKKVLFQKRTHNNSNQKSCLQVAGCPVMIVAAMAEKVGVLKDDIIILVHLFNELWQKYIVGVGQHINS